MLILSVLKAVHSFHSEFGMNKKPHIGGTGKKKKRENPSIHQAVLLHSLPKSY